MIKVELLNLVLKKEIIEIRHILDNTIHFKYMAEDKKKYVGSENLDTLGRLCKEWCFKQDCLLLSSKYDINDWVCYVDYDCEDTNKAYRGKTELEAIIKATEWVAKEKGLL